jgi:hypothetical protein
LAREFFSGVEAFANSLLSKVSTQERSDSRTNIDVQPDVRALNSLALRSLVALFNEKEQLFSQRVTLAADVSTAWLRRVADSRSIWHRFVRPCFGTPVG